MTVEEFEANYYVSWYVCKDGTPQQNDCWHIDGVVLKKTGTWNLSYDANSGDTSTIISTKQYKFKDTNDGENETATVHNSLRTFWNGEGTAPPAKETDIHPDRVGYEFIGWNTKPDGTGVSFTAGGYSSETGTEEEDFKDNDKITVDAEGNVFRNGEQVPNLKATLNLNGVYEVKLYAQWANGTNRLRVKKTAMDKTTALPGAEFKLSECTRGDNGVLVESKNLTGPNGSAVNENGILTIQNLENDKYYCLEEIVPPNGYELRTEKIYFSVLVADEANQTGEVMDLFILNEKGEKIDTPQWLQKSYSGGGSQGSGGVATIQFVFADKAIYQEVVFKKTKADGQTPLGGAQFQLYKGTKGADEQISYEQEPLDTSTLSAGAESKESGVFKFSNLKDDEGKKTQSLPYGYYKLVETTTPTGYKPTTVYFEINDPDTLLNNGMVVTGVEVDGKAVTFDQSKYSVKSEGTTTTVEGVEIIRYKYTLSVANLPSTKTVALMKVGSGETTRLSGAEFELYKDDKLTDKVNTELIRTNENGIALIGELDCGEYWLKETKAPVGYNLPTVPIKIIVETGKVTAMNGTVPDVQDKEETISEGKTGYILTIYNSKGVILPETGGPGTTMFTLGGVAVIAASLMYGLSMRRKKRKGGYY